jgi:hypothetical protein
MEPVSSLTDSSSGFSHLKFVGFPHGAFVIVSNLVLMECRYDDNGG